MAPDPFVSVDASDPDADGRRSVTFGVARRGYEPDQVDHVVEEMAAEIEGLREHVAELREREADLLAALDAADDRTQDAERRAEELETARRAADASARAPEQPDHDGLPDAARAASGAIDASAGLDEPGPSGSVAAVATMVGEETARIVEAARHAAVEIGARARDDAERIVTDAREEARLIRADAEIQLLQRTRETDDAVAERLLDAAAAVQEAQSRAEAIVADAFTEGATLVLRSRDEADALVIAGEARARELVDAAGAARDELLVDLIRRRKLLRRQVEQLEAGRLRLRSAYDVVESALTSATDELDRTPPEAREVALAAAARSDHAPDPELEATVTALGADPALVTSHPIPARAPDAESAPEPVDAVGPAEGPDVVGTGSGVADFSPIATTEPEAASIGGDAAPLAPALERRAAPTPVAPDPVAALDPDSDPVRQPDVETVAGLAVADGSTGSELTDAPAGTDAPAHIDEYAGTGAPTGSKAPAHIDEHAGTGAPTGTDAPAGTDAPVRTDPADGGVIVAPPAVAVPGDPAEPTVAPTAGERRGRRRAPDPVEFEGRWSSAVRVLPPGPETTEAGVPGSSGRSGRRFRSGSSAADVFARLRAGDSHQPSLFEPAPTSDTAEDTARASGSPSAVPAPTATAGAIVAGPATLLPAETDPEVEWLARRDAAVAPALRALRRRLKATLADDEDNLLESVRRSTTVPDRLDQVRDARVRRDDLVGAVTPSLVAAAAAGAELAGPDAVAASDHESVAHPPAVDELAAELADIVTEPLEERLDRSLARYHRSVKELTVTDVGAPVPAAEIPQGMERALASLVSSIKAAYRARRGAQVQVPTEHAVLAAAHRGLLAAVVPGTPLRWVVAAPAPAARRGSKADPDPVETVATGRACASCLAVADVGAGDSFGHGHLLPPARQGCRCAVAPVSAVVPRRP